MHPKQCARRPLLWGLTLAAALFGWSALAQPPVGGGQSKLTVTYGQTVVLDVFDQPPQDISTSQDNIVEIIRPKQYPGSISVKGLNAGDVQILVRMQNGAVRAYNVTVPIDYRHVQLMIDNAVPTAQVKVAPGLGNVLILSGYVTSPQDADVVARIANSAVGGNNNNVINAVQIGGIQQVQIDVVVASVDRNEVRSRGFDFAVNGSTVKFTSVVSGLVGSTGFAGGTPTVSPDANLALGIVPAQFFAALRALRTEGMAKFLAEPRVVTQTGRPASFLAGGRQAVLSPSSGINGPGVTYENIGTQLDVLPIVYGNNQIWLDITPSVRQVNQSLGITTVFGSTPGFTENTMRCSVMLESGQTFAIGGLIQNSVQASSARVPVLGDLPFVGTAFSRVNYEERESELVILVTPRLVAPMDCSQVPKRLPGRETRTPDDYELFLEGVLEAPRGQRKVWVGKCYNAPYKADPTACTYPCANNVSTGANCGTGACATGCQPAGGVPHGFTAAPATMAPVTANSNWSQPAATQQPMNVPVSSVPLPAIPGLPPGGESSLPQPPTVGLPVGGQPR